MSSICSYSNPSVFKYLELYGPVTIPTTSLVMWLGSISKYLTQMLVSCSILSCLMWCVGVMSCWSFVAAQTMARGSGSHLSLPSLAGHTTGGRGDTRHWHRHHQPVLHGFLWASRNITWTIKYIFKCNLLFQVTENQFTFHFEILSPWEWKVSVSQLISSIWERLPKASVLSRVGTHSKGTLQVRSVREVWAIENIQNIYIL